MKKSLVEQLNFSSSKAELEPNNSNNETLVLTGEQRVSLHCYDTFCNYFADNNIDVKQFSDTEFANAAEIFEDYVKSDLYNTMRFWVD